MSGLIAVIKVLLGLVLAGKLVKGVYLLPAAGIFLSYSKERYDLRFLVADVLLFSVALLALYRSGPPGENPFDTSAFRRQLRLGTATAALLFLILAVGALAAPGIFADQAKSLRLIHPRDFLVHGSFHSLIVAGYREELLYRAFATGVLVTAVPGSWGRLLPVLLFAGVHFFNDGPLGVRVAWALTTLPAALALTASFLAARRMYAPWLAHFLNNAAAVGIMALMAFLPDLVRPAGLALGAGALAWLAFHRADLAELWREIRATFSGLHLGAPHGLLLTTVLAAGLFLNEQVPWNNPGLALLLAAALGFSWLAAAWLASRQGRRQNLPDERRPV